MPPEDEGNEASRSFNGNEEAPTQDLSDHSPSGPIPPSTHLSGGQDGARSSEELTTSTGRHHCQVSCASSSSALVTSGQSLQSSPRRRQTHPGRDHLLPSGQRYGIGHEMAYDIQPDVDMLAGMNLISICPSGRPYQEQMPPSVRVPDEFVQEFRRCGDRPCPWNGMGVGWR